jgi:hypothetical protein
MSRKTPLVTCGLSGSQPTQPSMRSVPPEPTEPPSPRPKSLPTLTPTMRNSLWRGQYRVRENTPSSGHVQDRPRRTGAMLCGLIAYHPEERRIHLDRPATVQ